MIRIQKKSKSISVKNAFLVTDPEKQMNWLSSWKKSIAASLRNVEGRNI